MFSRKSVAGNDCLKYWTPKHQQTLCSFPGDCRHLQLLLVENIFKRQVDTGVQVPLQKYVRLLYTLIQNFFPRKNLVLLIN